jgi:alkaline phosphatase D
VGDLAEIFFLDERSFRNERPCRDTLSFGCKAFEASTRTMLGTEQKKWFLESLANANTVHKIVANETMMSPMLLSDSRHSRFFVNLDAWDGYPAERSEILTHIHQNRIGNVLFCTGDIHTSVVSNLHLESFAGARSPVVATELVAPSVTSATFTDFVGHPFSPLATAALRKANPQYGFVDTMQHGYVKVTATKEALQYRYVCPETIAQSKSNSFVLHSGALEVIVPTATP